MANTSNLLLWLAVVGMLVMSGETASSSIEEKCAPQFQKVTQCLSFVTAKAETPSKECCNSVTELKESDPACLCYIIEQVHNGSNAAVKSMGLQETRLLQLPTACNLVNASVAQCPKLLNLPPNSPEAGIFSNTSSTPVATPATSSSTTAGSKAEWHKPPQAAGLLMVAAVIFFHAFPSGITLS